MESKKAKGMNKQNKLTQGYRKLVIARGSGSGSMDKKIKEIKRHKLTNKSWDEKYSVQNVRNISNITVTSHGGRPAAGSLCDHCVRCINVRSQCVLHLQLIQYCVSAAL